MTTSPKRLLFVLPRFHTNIYWATRALAEAGHTVSVIAFETKTEQELHDVIRPITAKDMPREEFLAAIKTLQPECMIVRASKEIFEWAALYSKKNLVPLIKYDLLPVPKPWRLPRWLGVGPEPASQKYRISPVPKKSFETKGTRKSFFLPFPVGPGDGKLHTKENKRLRVLCVGKLLQPRKNHIHVLSALSHFPQAQERLELTFCGTTASCKGMSQDYYRDLRKQAAAMNALAGVSFRENVKFEEMDQLYAAHDLCIMPSYAEPLGVAPLEAMSFGVIPFISREAGASKYLRDGFNGYVIDPHDPLSTGKKMLALLENDYLRFKMSERAKGFAQAELSGEAFVKRFEAILRRVGV